MNATETPSSARRRRPVRSILIAASVFAAVAIATAGWYSSSGTKADTGVAALGVADIPPFGSVLVDQKGQAIYQFEPDEPGVVTCTAACARKWPPLTLAPGQTAPDLGPGIDKTLIGSAKGEGGAHVVTYNGSPLYRYSSDGIGEVSGHNKDQNGGLWYALTPTGERAK